MNLIRFVDALFWLGVLWILYLLVPALFTGLTVLIVALPFIIAIAFFIAVPKFLKRYKE